MFKKHRALLKKGLYFKSIYGQLDITCGIMTLKDFRMKSPLLNAVGKGTIDLKDETVDIVIGVEPLGKITTEIDKIPLSGYVLTNKVKSLMTYYFHVKCPLSDPAVKYLSPTKLTKDMIRNAKKLFFSPMRLFKKRAKEKK